MIAKAGLTVVRESPCVARLVQVGAERLGISAYNSRLLVRLDAWYSRLAGFRRPYHATRWWQRLFPVAVYYVLQKPLR
jgi:hypothetical protein